MRERLGGDLVRSRQNRQGDREIVAPAFLGQVHGGEIDRDAPLREVEAGVDQGGANALLALLDGGLGQSDHRERGQPTRKMHLDVDGGGLDPGEGAAADDGQGHGRARRRTSTRASCCGASMLASLLGLAG